MKCDNSVSDLISGEFFSDDGDPVELNKVVPAVFIVVPLYLGIFYELHFISSENLELNNLLLPLLSSF